MASRRDRPALRPLIISLLLTGLALVGGVLFIPGFTGRRILSALAWPLMRLMLFIALGLVIGQIIEAAGWAKKLAIVARPLFGFGRLGDHCGAAFTAAFFSGVAANAMLLDFFKEEIINRKQLFLANFINQLPAFFLHLPTTFFIVIPLTGRAGIIYFILTFAAVALRTAGFLIYGHLRLPPSADDTSATSTVPQPTEGSKDPKEIWRRIRSRLPGRLAGIATFVVPIYILVSMLNKMGMFDYLREALSGYVVTAFMPMESLSVIILSFAAEFTSGFAAAGALLQAGVLTIKQIVLALLIGNILAFPIRALRHQLPRYMGIFSPKMGAQILFLGQGLRIVSLVAVGIIYYFIG